MQTSYWLCMKIMVVAFVMFKVWSIRLSVLAWHMYEYVWKFSVTFLF